jgi:hypothetical protein
VAISCPEHATTLAALFGNGAIDAPAQADDGKTENMAGRGCPTNLIEIVETSKHILLAERCFSSVAGYARVAD